MTSGGTCRCHISADCCVGNLSCVFYNNSMKTLTIRLPDALVSEIGREARVRRISKSAVVRERLMQIPLAADSQGSTAELIGDILKRSWQSF